MANTILTPQMITREAQRILHQKINVIGNVNRQYDSRFANRGAKIGDTLDIKLPAKYTTRRGPTLAAQNSVERKVSLPVADMYGVDMTFTTQELTMDIDNFSRQFIDPAMAQLAASIESDFLSYMYKKIANYVNTPSAQMSYKSFQQAGAVLSQNLAPTDNNRHFVMTPQSSVEFRDAVKGLFQDSASIKEQYLEGMMGRTGGFSTYENTLLPNHTVGTLGGTPEVLGANQGTAGTGNAWAETTDLVTNGWTPTTATLNAGDIFTIENVFEVHPETKANTGRLKKFVVQELATADGAGEMTVTISPAIILSGAYQSVSAAPANGADITVIGSANDLYGQDIAFHRDSFVFASADLELPGDGKFEARETFEGLSMRMIRKYDINNDRTPARIDVLVGWTAVYPELACRHLFNPV